MTGKVLITGSTGATGSAAITRLLELEVPIRALVHTADGRADELRNKGVEVVQGDLSDFDSVTRALEGISSAYFVYPIQVPGILEATAFFAQAALEGGVTAIVNMSQITARRTAKSHAATAHWLAERLFDRSGVAVTHLRPTLFCEWLLYFASAIRDQSVLALPFGDARYAPIAGEDQGRAIAAILNDPAKHPGMSYTLFGPREISQYETADMLSAALGRKITYVPMEIEPFKAVLKQYGFNAHFQQHIGAVAEDCRNGVCSGMNDCIEELTGRKPLQMMDFISTHKAAFV
jgi:NAD(P)H dehydrogenase (quinone)